MGLIALLAAALYYHPIETLTATAILIAVVCAATYLRSS